MATPNIHEYSLCFTVEKTFGPWDLRRLAIVFYRYDYLNKVGCVDQLGIEINHSEYSWILSGCIFFIHPVYVMSHDLTWMKNVIFCLGHRGITILFFVLVFCVLQVQLKDRCHCWEQTEQLRIIYNLLNLDIIQHFRDGWNLGSDSTILWACGITGLKLLCCPYCSQLLSTVTPDSRLFNIVDN